MKILVVDFDDSFTFNISEYFFRKGFDVETIHWKKFLEKDTSHSVVILGPGPGSPDEYRDLFPMIKSLKKREDIFIMGICLGHQLIWGAEGLSCIPLERPVHGQTTSFYIPFLPDRYPPECCDKKLEVQLYNSLTLDNSSSLTNFWPKKGAILAGFDERVVSYQFHPESVGTEGADILFYPIFQFISKSKRGILS